MSRNVMRGFRRFFYYYFGCLFCLVVWGFFLGGRGLGFFGFCFGLGFGDFIYLFIWPEILEGLQPFKGSARKQPWEDAAAAQ